MMRLGGFRTPLTGEHDPNTSAAREVRRATQRRSAHETLVATGGAKRLRLKLRQGAS